MLVSEVQLTWKEKRKYIYKSVKTLKAALEKFALGTGCSLATEDSSLNLLCNLGGQSNRLPLPDLHT